MQRVGEKPLTHLDSLTMDNLPSDLQQLQTRAANGEQFEFLLFWGCAIGV